VAPGTAVDGCSSSAEGVAAKAAALKLAHKAIVLTPVTNTFMNRLLSGKKDAHPPCARHENPAHRSQKGYNVETT